MQEPLNGGSLGNRRCSYEQSLFYFIEARFHYFDFTGVSCQIPYTIIFSGFLSLYGKSAKYYGWLKSL